MVTWISVKRIFIFLHIPHVELWVLTEMSLVNVRRHMKQNKSYQLLDLLTAKASTPPFSAVGVILRETERI